MASVGVPAGSAVPGVAVAASVGDAVGDVLSNREGPEPGPPLVAPVRRVRGGGTAAVMALRHRSGLASALSGRAPIPVAAHRQE
ncbi:hypothetical protein SNE510_58440 [Streptomyces sp. NE5-10]|nr:hypothetical protein SNE510_58440 [Streptomyces sp. NE5-10]